MKKETKNILTKLALVAAPFAFAATISTSAVSANADSNTIGDWDMTPAEKANAEAEDKLAHEHMEENGTIGKKSDEEAIANQKAIDAKYRADIVRNHKEFGDPIGPVKKASTTKKTTKKKVVKKNARHLFRIKVKTNKVYAYKNIKLHKAGRKLEKKGTKLYVYGIVKKGHKIYYKIAGGRVITSAHKYVTKIAK